MRGSKATLQRNEPDNVHIALRQPHSKTKTWMLHLYWLGDISDQHLDMPRQCKERLFSPRPVNNLGRIGQIMVGLCLDETRCKERIEGRCVPIRPTSERVDEKRHWAGEIIFFFFSHFSCRRCRTTVASPNRDIRRADENAHANPLNPA
jgi:hypothetical protein